MGICLSKKKFVRIVHAGGQKELYRSAVPASMLMEKYPGMCIARPEVFKSPHKSLLGPEETLLPGHKYYVIPSNTAQKLKRKHSKNNEVKSPTEDKENISDALISLDTGRGHSEDFILYAKEFYTSRERWLNGLRRRNGREKKPFVPPLPRARMPKELGWMPRLSSVQEVSP
ncbi:hypothetical protein HS088_TW06G00733 [Tripterygium wilfordii]|uniref:DUF4228 domain protein n=1 Tax=Tripterygium wilfordii TaxID=458696 RepID=A0A7J7DJM7_TRIWF|nr:uncharacterized protein LOC120000410 [Tripterygium wilfordii]KAF5746562.1 hypothetical protein HS088_TW06G00733 [Tripterygium wilfordii]